MRTKIKITIEKVDLFRHIYTGYIEDKKIFSNTIHESEGICEFIGAIHGLMYIRKHQLYGDVFIKNSYIKHCIENKKFKHKANNEREKDLLRRANLFLCDMKSNINIELYD